MVREFRQYWRWRLAVFAARAFVHTDGEMFLGGVWQQMGTLGDPARLPNKWATRPLASTKAMAIWFSSDGYGAVADTPGELGEWMMSKGEEENKNPP